MSNVGEAPGFQGNDVITHTSIRNFYDWLEQFSNEVYKLYPWWPCLLENRDKPNSCKGGCCNHSAFMVSEVEANEFLAELRTRSPEEIGYIVRRAQFLFEEYLRPRIIAGKSLTDICLEIGHEMYVCPLWDIKTGKCTIYNNRPIICRTFGHFLDAKHKTTFYSETVGQALKAKIEETGQSIKLPDWDVVRREMGSVIGGRTAPIVVWILMAFS